MRTRRIGSLEVSVVGLGCNNFGGRLDAPATAQVVGAALEAGITFFDTADIYGDTRSEEFLGPALGTRRDEIVLATKFGVPYEGHPGGGAPDSVRGAAEASLRRLGTDRIDLYQLHFPDAKTAIADTLGALGELVAEGKVREIGCSNFDAALLREAGQARAPGAPGFVSVQNQYSLLHREPEASVLAECEQEGLAFLPYFPLANGLLSGKYGRDRPVPEGTRIGGLPEQRRDDVLSEDNLTRIEGLRALAEGHGHSLLDLAVAWLLSRGPVASVIAGATRAEQVRANAGAADWELPAEVVAAVDQIVPA
jgi:aryl-alcohol dehydrogenase-like predicted oxidoreductase